MSTHRPSKSLSAATLMALAISAGLPPLGQQARLTERPNAPGERLRPPPPKRKRIPTSFDLERIANAEAKRERRAQRDSRNLANGCQRQTATPRDA